MADANIRAVITAEDRASATLKKVQGGIEDVGNSASKFLGDATAQASAVAVAGITAIGFAAFDMVKSFNKSEEVGAQLNAVLQSTAGVAGVTADQATKLASALQKVTKYSDEDIQSAENLLLTFTAISKDIFPDATKIVLDMSTALGQDLKSSSIQLGKALQDPILGVTALRRVGVNFSDKQQDVIKALVETGQKAKAQELIMKELRTEFGGSAEAAGKTFTGQLAILGNQLDDVKEKVGGLIVKAFQPLIKRALEVIEAINWDQVISNTVKAVTNFKDKFIEFTKPIADFLRDHKESILDFMKRFGTTGLIVVPILAGLALAFATLTNPLFLIVVALTLGWELWEKHRVLFLALTVVLAPLALAFAAIKVSMMFSATVEALNAAIVILTGTDIAATFAANGLAAALWAVLAAAAGPITLVVIGVAAIWAAVEAVKALDEAWNGAAQSASQSNALDNKAYKSIQNNPNLTKQQKHDRLLGLMDPGFRAEGGPVTAGKPYIVGEKRPELFIPNQNGTIVPKVPTGQPSTVNITVQAGAFMGNPSEARAYARMIMEHMKDIAGTKNMTASEMLS